MLIRTSLLALDQAARLQFNVGDGLDLWLDDRRLGARHDDRDISLRLTRADLPEELVRVHVRGQIGSIEIEESFDPAPNLFFDHVWDGTSGDPAAPGTPANLVTHLEIGWELEEVFPRPHRIKWWRKPIVVGGVDLRSLGCGGITPDAVHHYDVGADTMWRGNGSRMLNARASNPSHLNRLRVAGNELAIVDGAETHVFNSRGVFKRTLSTLKGYEITNARTDDDGRVTSWTKAGHRYTIDRRNDSEALLRSPAGVWAVIDFDERGRAAVVTDQDKSMATLEYTAAGGLAKVVDSAGLVTEIERDDLGRVTRFSDSTGRSLELIRTEVEGGTQVTVMTAEGRETRHRTERHIDGSHVETHTCCGASQPRIVEHRSLGPLGHERIVRTPTGMTATTRTSSRATSESTDQIDRTWVVSPAGRTLNIDRRIRRYRSGKTKAALTIGEATGTKELDPATHTSVSKSPTGQIAIAKLVPGKSLDLEVPGSGTLRLDYDIYGRVRRRDRNGEVVNFGYDQNGRLTWGDFERWRQHVHHDEQGNVQSVETPDGWLQIARDDAGRFVALKAPSGAVTTIGRRPDGLITSIEYPGARGANDIELLQYDRDGLMIGHQYSDEHVIGFDRDLAGRVVNVTAPDVKISAEYDHRTGQINKITSVEGDNVSFQYDGDFEVIEESMGRVPGRIDRVYDENHRVVERRVNGAQPHRYERDLDGYIVSAGPLSIERSTKGRQPVVSRLGSLTTTREFDDNGRLKSHKTVFGRLAQVYFAEEIERDLFGRIAKITETARGRTRVIEYTYSDARRLSAVAVDGQETMRLSYDSNGNIVELDRGGRALPMEFDAGDRLTTVAGQPVTHDDGGNLTGIGADGSIRSYRFDGLGHLVGSQDAHSEMTHTLDAIGRPILVEGAGAPLRLLWDGDRVAATLDPLGRVDMRFIDTRLASCPDALERNGIEYMLVKDHLGSVRVVVDAVEGEVVQALDYDVLGRPTMNTEPGWQPFGFAGGLHDTTGGLIRFQARTYDPFVGRFLSRDPLGFAGGQVNLYQYALGDPVNNVDPTGMIVGPSGEMSVSSDEFAGKRPLHGDHLYMRSQSWVDGVQPRTTLGAMGQLLATWKHGATFSDNFCRTLSDIESGCPDPDPHRWHLERRLDGRWAQNSNCFGPEWNSTEIASFPEEWMFADQDRSVPTVAKDAVEHVRRLPRAIANFRATAGKRLPAFIDAQLG